MVASSGSSQIKEMVVLVATPNLRFCGAAGGALVSGPVAATGITRRLPEPNRPSPVAVTVTW